MPQVLELRGNTIGMPTQAGYCGKPTKVCVLTKNGSAHVPYAQIMPNGHQEEEQQMTPRSVEARIAYMKAHPPGRVGRCAETVWKSLNVPPIGAASAAIAVGKVRAAGKLHTSHNPPRGAIVLWTGGSHGYGHAALSLGNGRILTTDPPGHAGGVGETALNMPEVRWGHHYAGWTTWWGVNLPGTATVPPAAPSQPKVSLSNLRYGTRHADVKVLQRALHVSPVSGFYGDLTDRAVRAHQARQGWTPDAKGHSFVGARQAKELGLATA
jgi:hypothetical protein